MDEAGKPLRLGEVPEPRVRGGGAVVDVLAVHIPAYTAALTQGARGDLPTPLVLGAAGIGRVRAVADDVFNVEPGDLVVATALLSTGAADAPEEILVGWTGVGGRGVATERTRAMQAVWRDGMSAEQALCPKEVLIRLPGADGHPPERLAFLPWLSIAAEGLERAGQRAGDSVVVLGATGQLGTAAVLVALARGASRVVAVGRNATVLDGLKALDHRVLPVRLTGNGDAAAILAAGGPADVVLDALGPVPGPGPTLAGFGAVRDGGSLVLIGGVRQDLPLPYGQLMRRRLTVRGSWMASPATVLTVWHLVASGLIDLGALEIHRVGLDDPGAALELAARTSGPAAVVLVP
ncbi:alcohol dehydrogenase [Amycolatopsis bartoniae]|uniref:Alcohol dehydrogenase n=1 Tax=Amycolatopsis bartoniae TaxID=941986 RepID=A0A8H9IVN8_9PSEU|nr:alcohol dehydrogenase [Amycolatopsis bartoniae]